MITYSRVIVLGGGMVGMLAKFLFPDALVLDWRKVPPKDPNLNGARQYGAQYLWEPLPGIVCKDFHVYTTIDGEPATIEAARQYKIKIGKSHDLFDDATGIHKPDAAILAQFPYKTTGWMITDMPGLKQEVTFNAHVTRLAIEENQLHMTSGTSYCYGHLISAIPLPALLKMMRIRTAPFVEKPVCVRIEPLPLDAPPLAEGLVRVNYISNPRIIPYRTTDKGDGGTRHYEWLQGAGGAGRRMGVPAKILSPGKIMPHPEAGRIVKFLAGEDIFCHGRFPAWQPDELLHQTYGQLLKLQQQIGDP